MPVSYPPVPSGQFLSLPVGWDTAWKAAKTLIGSQRVNVVAIGDSITAGQNSTDIMLDSWFAKFRAAMLAQYNNALGGDHYGLLYAASQGLSTATPPLVTSGVNSTDWTAFYCGFNRGLFAGQTTLTPYIACTPPYNVVGFDILYIDYAAGTWTWNIDGAANTTVTTTGPGTSAGAIVKKTSIAGLASAAHTLNINTSSVGVNTCNILGVTGYASTTGLCFANMGWTGMGLFTGQNTNNSLADTGKFPPDRLALYQGYQGTTVAPSQLSGLGFPSQPDLAIISFGVNDANQSVTRANFRDALDRLVYSLRYGKADACSIIICAQYTADGNAASATVVTNEDYTSAGVTSYRDIKAAMIEVAAAQNCAFVDVHGAFGRKPVANGWIHNATDIHPSVAGYLKIANLLGSII
jgi:lysophospholipase L1-like esterase